MKQLKDKAYTMTDLNKFEGLGKNIKYIL